MKKTVNFDDFQQAFVAYGREKNFSYEGLRSLYDYFIELEEETDDEFELDPIAFCCNYTEYASLAEFNCNFDTECNSIDAVADLTTVISIVDSEGLIIDTNF